MKELYTHTYKYMLNLKAIQPLLSVHTLFTFLTCKCLSCAIPCSHAPASTGQEALCSPQAIAQATAWPSGTGGGPLLLKPDGALSLATPVTEYFIFPASTLPAVLQGGVIMTCYLCRAWEGEATGVLLPVPACVPARPCSSTPVTQILSLQAVEETRRVLHNSTNFTLDGECR